MSCFAKAVVIRSTGQSRTPIPLALAVLGLLSLDGSATGAAGTAGAGECAVTRANDRGYVTDDIRLRHGNDGLATSLYPTGRFVFRPGGAGCIDESGALWIKWPWWRKVPGDLHVETRRADGTGDALSAKIPCCYGASGFQVSLVGFPGPGCWQVTGRVAERTLPFVTLVETIGDGPPRCEGAPSEERPPAAAGGA